MKAFTGVLDSMREEGEVNGEEGDRVGQEGRIHSEDEVSGCRQG